MYSIVHRDRWVLSWIGLVLFFAFEYVCFSSGRAVVSIAKPIFSVVPYNILGVLVSAFVFDALSKTSIRTGRPSLLSVGYLLLVCIASLAAAGCWLLAERWPEQSLLFSGVMAFCGGAPFVVLLDGYFQSMRREHQGLWLGAALAAGEVIWIVFRLLPPSAADLSAMRPWLALLLLGAGGCAAAVLSLSAPPRDDAPACRRMCPLPLLRQTLYYLLAIGTLFCLLDALPDVIFFRYDSVSSPIPKNVGLFVWIGYPLLGLFLDRKGGGGKFFLICLGLCILSPALTAISQRTAAYWVIFTADIIGRHGAFLFMLLIMARYAKDGRISKIVYVLPYVIQYAAYLLVFAFIEKIHPGPAFTILFATFLSCAFSYIASKVQYAVAMTGYEEAPLSEPRRGETVTAGAELEVSARHQKFVLYIEKHGLSPRESDVMKLVLMGLGITEMGQHLHVSEHTIRSHVRNLLRKADMPSRNALMASFFNMP